MPGVSKENQAKTGPLNDETMEDLLVGYKILHDTLRKESQLKYLHWLRDATFNGPKGSLKTIMTRIYTTSQKLSGELEDLWEEYQPRILIEQAPVSPMGDSIQADVEKSSTSELVPLPSLPLLLFTASTASSSAASSSSSDSDLQRLQWGIRFVFIQAQATRMVVALSTSLKKFETNQQRKQWLTELAKEFESIRESLVEYVLRNLDEGAWKD